MLGPEEGIVGHWRIRCCIAAAVLGLNVASAGAAVWQPAPSLSGTPTNNTSLAELDGVLYTGSDAQFYGYTTETGVWRALAPLPFTRYALRIVAGSDGRLYAIGGSTAYTTAYANVDAYDPHTNTWAAVAPLPLPRNSPAAVSAPDGRIYVAAGQKDFSYPGDEFTATTFAYRPGDPAWTTLTAPGLFGRYNATGMLLRDGRMLIAGGFTAWVRPPDGSAAPNLTSAQTFNPASSAWTSVASMQQPRQAPADGAVGCDGRAYVAGGIAGPANDTVTNTVEQFDPLSGVWSYAPPLPSPHVAGGMALAPGGQLYLAGGFTQAGPATQVLSLDTRPTARTWCGAATGFERGALTGWATARNLRVVTGEAYTGSYGAQLSSTGPGGAYARLTLPALQDSIFYRAWFRPTTQGPRPVTLLQLRTLLGAMISVQRLPSGQLSLANELTGRRLTSSSTLALGTWHRIELRAALTGLTGQMSVFLDGAPVAGLSSTQLLLGRVAQIQLGDNSSGPPWSLGVDNVNADNHFLDG